MRTWPLGLDFEGLMMFDDLPVTELFQVVNVGIKGGVQNASKKLLAGSFVFVGLF